MNLIVEKDLDPDSRELLKLALEVRENAYAPYSKYKVGAALIDEKGNIHTGCNVETAVYTTTTHAEMLAIDSMIKTGTKKIKKILIALKGDDRPATPCGLCRQKMVEFAHPDLEIISVNLDDNDNINKIFSFTLAELIPYSFDSSFFVKP